MQLAKGVHEKRKEAEGRPMRWLSKRVGGVRLDSGAAAATPSAASGGGPLCIACDERRADRMCQPCGHLCLCGPCAPAIERSRTGCPMCRGDLDRIQTVYF